MKKLFHTLPIFALTFAAAAAAPPPPKFRAQDIGAISIGYGIAIADVDGDGKPDILLADQKTIQWYHNPDWTKHVMAENLTRIFNHGFTTKKDGHGFGLHSGANAAREMGGSLTAHSEGTGHGATFRLELPVSKNTVQDLPRTADELAEPVSRTAA